MVMPGGCDLSDDFEICQCDCHHQPDGVMAAHVMACCSQCRYCGKDRIAMLFIDIHEESCKNEHPDLGPPCFFSIE